MPQTQCVILTVTYNNANTITQMIDSLRPESDSIAQLVIVDNGSTDDTARVAEDHVDHHGIRAHVIRSRNTGFAGGYETARRHVTSEGPILCVNPDVALAPGTVGRLLQAVALPETAIATAPLRNLEGTEDSASRRRLPTLGTAAAYAALGKFLPRRFRYNSRPGQSFPAGPTLDDGTKTSVVEATTGALMMLAPRFRTANQTLFDLDYWMYGEDLQLCRDASRASLEVLMVETEPSLHIKGASSGLPRSRRSDRAFHDALFLYYRKNLSRGSVEAILIRTLVECKFIASRLRALTTGRSR